MRTKALLLRRQRSAARLLAASFLALLLPRAATAQPTAAKSQADAAKQIDLPPPKAWVTQRVLVQSEYDWSGGRGADAYQKANGSGLDNGFRLARVSLRFFGRAFEHWIFDAAVELGKSQPGGPQPIPTVPSVADAWVGYEVDPLLRILMGQIPLPFTIDANEIYPTRADFLEPTATTRFITAPDDPPLGIMAWGESNHAIYGLGYVSPGGQTVLRGTGDLVGRAAVRPFGDGPDMIEVGVGGRWGSRDPANVWSDAPSLTNATYSYTFWSPVYNTDLANEFHVLPSNEQRTLGASLAARFGPLDFVAEGTLVHQERREIARGFPTQSLAAGLLSGATYYATLTTWLVGAPGIITDQGHGIPNLPPIYAPKAPLAEGFSRRSLQIGARWEQLLLGYDSVARSPGTEARGFDRETQRLRLDSLQLIVNFFIGRAVRLSAEYTTFMTPGEPSRLLTDCSTRACAPGVGHGTNQAVSPGAIQRGNLTAGTFEGDYKVPAPGAQGFHQLALRAQIIF